MWRLSEALTAVVLSHLDWRSHARAQRVGCALRDAARRSDAYPPRFDFTAMPLSHPAWNPACPWLSKHTRWLSLSYNNRVTAAQVDTRVRPVIERLVGLRGLECNPGSFLSRITLNIVGAHLHHLILNDWDLTPLRNPNVVARGVKVLDIGGFYQIFNIAPLFPTSRSSFCMALQSVARPSHCPPRCVVSNCHTCHRNVFSLP